MGLAGNMKKVLGITGNMASGKSYTCNELAQIAANKNIPFHIIDVDKVRRNILQFSNSCNHMELRKKIAGTLQLGLSLSNQLPGNMIGEVIFSDSQKRKKYENLINPEIKKELQLLIQPLNGLIIVEWAMLIEDKMLNLVDYNLVLITCANNIRMHRLKNSDLSLRQLQKRIQCQPADTDRITRIKEIYQNKKNGFYTIFDTGSHPDKCEFEKLFDLIFQEAL
ncbi:MAG TPA: hypothetical protein DF296_03575 [Candidatus Margulisbacteria bacterium]|nr:hypothetical protein [Candidatus Margulisiibacteriota bacterium]HCT84261.1 hypothetical protein [Candidatus Margulisiibacteriota bacterium]